MESALESTPYRCIDRCVQLVILVKDFDLKTAVPKADASIGVIAVNVHTTKHVNTSMEPTVIEDLNAVLAVLPNAELPSDVQDHTELLKVHWFSDEHEILDCILMCAKIHSGRSRKSGKKHAGAVQHLIQGHLGELDRKSGQHYRRSMFGLNMVD